MRFFDSTLFCAVAIAAVVSLKFGRFAFMLYVSFVKRSLFALHKFYSVYFRCAKI